MRTQTIAQVIPWLLLLAGEGLAAFPARAAALAAKPAPSNEAVVITVDAKQREGGSIPRTIFGTFLEPIGNSVYGGLWAELLENPSLEENLWSAPRVAEMLRERPSLTRASSLALPLPWEPLDPSQGNRYEPRWGDAANSWRSLAIFGVPGQATGIEQQVYLPVARELAYHGSFYARHLSGPSSLTVSLRKRGEGGQVLASADVNAADPKWTRYEFTLTLSPGGLKPLEAADFALQLTGDERVEVDQFSLTPADAVDGMDPDVIAMARDMHTPLLRFGGNYTSAYHWRDGTGPMEKRVSMLNIAWGIPEYNQFGTDEFLRFCQLIGAEPQIALNLGSGTPEEAADWVRYVDDRWPTHGGLLWELGNELWGNWNVGSPTLGEIAERTQRFSEAVRKADPRARLIATGADPDHFEKWNAAQLTDPPETFQFLSTHFVVTTDRLEQNNPQPDTVARDAFAMPVALARKLAEMQNQIDARAGDKGRVHIAFTEWLWGCCRGRETPDAPRFDNEGGAVITGGFLNMLMRNAQPVPVSDMTGLMEFAGIWKEHGQVYGTPSYYVFQMYAGADLKTQVKVSSDAGKYDVQHGVTRAPDIPGTPYLDMVAAVNEKGDAVTLFVVNRHLDEDVAANIDLNGFTKSGRAEVESLYANSIYDRNDGAQPKHVIPVKSTAEWSGGALHYAFHRASVTRIVLHRQ